MKKGGKVWHVYILASQINGTLYIGYTNSLLQRVHEHKTKKYPRSFASKYNVNKLVYYEAYSHPGPAFRRETQVKKWNRAWKMDLINKENPSWRDLYPEIIDSYK